MRRTGIAIVVVAVVAMQDAHAAPQVAGTYGLITWTLCQAQFKRTITSFVKSVGPAGAGSHQHNAPTGPGIQNINPQSSGEIGIGVGTITFDGTPASSGNATITFQYTS